MFIDNGDRFLFTCRLPDFECDETKTINIAMILNRFTFDLILKKIKINVLRDKG